MTISETSPQYAVQWRAFIGPKWVPSTDPAYYPWTALSLGTYEPVPAATTLADDLEPGATSADLTGATGYPAAGGIWVGAGAAGERLEYVSHTGKSTDTLTGLTRDAITAEQSGHHTAGAPVCFWFPVLLDWPFHPVESGDDKLAAFTWQADLKGSNMPVAALRNEHLVLLQARWAEGSGAWSDWGTELIGWLLTHKGHGDGQNYETWEATAGCSASLLENAQVPGVHLGPKNAALQAEVTTSSDLVQVYKETGSGEFVAAAPDLSGASATDGKMSTLWMSDKFVGASNLPTAQTGYLVHMADQIHIAPYAGQSPAGYRWLSLAASDTKQEGWGVELKNTDGYYPSDGANHNTDGYVWNQQHPFTTGKYTPVIFVENEILFRAENPNLGQCQVIEISGDPIKYTGGFLKNDVYYPAYTAQDWWNGFDPAGGSLKVLVNDGSSKDNLAGVVYWGTATPASPWTGTTQAAPAPGETIRRTWANSGNTEAGWTTGHPSMPGYYLAPSAYVPPGQYWLPRFEWLNAKTVGLGLRLRDAIDDTQTDGIVVTSAGGDTLEGLDSSGTIQIGQYAGEQITYTLKDEVNSQLAGTVTRGANGTANVPHNAGDQVFTIDGGVAVDASPVNGLRWRRAVGMPQIHDFKIYASKLDTPRLPTPDGYLEYVSNFDLIATITGATADVLWAPLSPAVRYRNALTVVTAMETDPYRVAINELEIVIDPACFPADRNLASGTAADLISAVLKLGGLDDDAIIDAGGTPSLTNLTTDVAGAWKVAADIANFSGCRVTCGRDSKVTIGLDPFRDIASLPAETLNLTKTLLKQIDPDWNVNLAVGQVALSWRSSDGQTEGVERYPATRLAIGSVLELGPMYCADATAAQTEACKQFWMARRPFGIPAEMAGPGWNRHAGDFFGVEWTFGGGTYLLDRTYAVKSIEHDFDKGRLTSCPVLLQVSGEGEI
jgi:hypothetical protein